MISSLLHENIHKMLTEALNSWNLIKHETTYKNKFLAEEVYTETLAMLIRNQGDADKALEEIDRFYDIYSPGVKVLLSEIQRVNTFSKDPYAGAKLLFQGISDVANGQVNDPLDPLIKYYDTSVRYQGRYLREILEPFANNTLKGRITIPNSVPKMNSENFSETKNVLRGMKINDLSEEAKISLTPEGEEEKVFAHAVDVRITDPISLLTIPIQGEPLYNKEIAEIVLNDAEARAELMQALHQYYQTYVDGIKKAAGIISPATALPEAK